jgi:O-antigen ligase
MIKYLSMRGDAINFAFHKFIVALFALFAVLLGVLVGLAAGISDFLLITLLSILVMGIFALIALYHPLSGFLVWLFLHTFIDSWVEIDLGAGIPDISFGRFAILVLLVSVLMRMTTGRLRMMPLSATDLFALATPFAIALSAPLSTQPTQTLQTALTLYFLPLAAYWLAKQLVRNANHLTWLLGLIAFFGALAGAHALYEALTGNMIIMTKGQEIGRLYRGDTNLRLIEGLIGETGAMGRVLAITLLVTLYTFAESKSSLFKPFWIVAALVQFGGLLVTLSRTPILTFLAGLLILQFFYPTLRRILIVLALIVSLALAFSWQQVQQTQAAQERLDGIEDYNGRSARWQAGINMWLEQPVRGWGMGRYAEWSGRFRADGSRQNIDAVESDYLLILVGAGLVGFAPYALFLFSATTGSLRLFARRKWIKEHGFIRTGTIGLIWSVLLCFLVGSFLAINQFNILRILPFVLIGAIVGTHQPLLARHLLRQSAQRLAHDLTQRAATLPLPSPRPVARPVPPSSAGTAGQ